MVADRNGDNIEYIDELGDNPIMVLENDTDKVSLVNKRLPKEQQDMYIILACGELSE